MSLILINSSFEFCLRPRLFSLTDYKHLVNHVISLKTKNQIFAWEQLVTTNAFMWSVMELQSISCFLTFKYINKNLLIRLLQLDILIYKT